MKIINFEKLGTVELSIDTFETVYKRFQTNNYKDRNRLEVFFTSNLRKEP